MTQTTSEIAQRISEVPPEPKRRRISMSPDTITAKESLAAADNEDTKGQTNQQTLALLTLPTEIRLRIYSFVFFELEIYRTRTYPAVYKHEIRNQSALLLTCRKIHNEAQPFLYSAPIIAHGGEIEDQLDFRSYPSHVNTRIQTAVTYTDTFSDPFNYTMFHRYGDTSRTRAYACLFLGNPVFSSLRTIWIKPPTKWNRDYTSSAEAYHFPRNLDYPVDMMPILQNVLRNPDHYTKSQLLHEFLLDCQSPDQHLSCRHGYLLLEAKRLIKRRNLVLKSEYHFTIRVKQIIDQPRSGTYFLKAEERFKTASDIPAKTGGFQLIV